MLRWFLRRQIASFEHTWNHDASYLHELIDIDPQAMLALGKLQAISNYHKGVSPVARSAAGIVSVMSEDCGPCTQLAIDMAARGGVDPAVLRAVVALAFAMLAGRTYPILKYALGHGHACMRLTIGGETRPVSGHCSDAAVPRSPDAIPAAWA